ncbi:extracellular solute-binding protein [Pseudoroseomonas wenyumeiae]|uniref:Extracellular solute-binding protein n=1 Tax=Teichococcus wenyumeiae TaxID=2478470 RepID=A0A3A9JJM4_9PROT|nr:sugar ABC transporter substrate-binding protein [Pseudoroseomonas wenyumeiae]RKK05431.1 sugar ABC transporter substrate-binding protein [Pseudoroseomonas wenyumeiae]RMI19631.1 extracellular solute-binding protein [Pseudoroseomonas wenyumeiae]
MIRRCLAVLSTALGLTLAATAPGQSQTILTVATVNNADMVVMQRLSSRFEQQNANIRLRWVVLEENVLRQRVTTDIATRAGQFDILTIGNYEVPIWAKQGWLSALENLPADYDVNDLLAPVREAISDQGKLYALPFYAESAMTYYRTDLLQKAGITMPEKPTYAQLREMAEKVTDKGSQTYGLCLRGKPGWGENMAFVTPLVTAFGGQWFDKEWRPTINTPQWRDAVTWYSESLRQFGPPGATSNGFNENLALMAGGRCGFWIDSTVAAGLLYDAKQSQIAERVGFAPIPTGSYAGGPTWLWSWNLAIPASSKQQEAARSFITWATSKDYIKLVAQENGWVAVPPGTRQSTYDNPDYKKVAPFAGFVQQAIMSANPGGPTREPRPYTGAQFVAIPEFQGIGTQVGQTIASTLTGTSVENALRSAQSATERTMRQAGYPK